MGKQVNFYLIHADTVKLEAKLRDITPLIVLHSRSDSSIPRVLEHLDHEEHGQYWLYFYLVRPEDFNNVVMRHVPAQGYWTVDVLMSPVIEFQRCFSDGHNLKRGRIYYVDKFYGANDELVEKTESFRKWVKSILSTTKKGLSKHDSYYIGEATKAWLTTSGGALVQ